MTIPTSIVSAIAGLCTCALAQVTLMPGGLEQTVLQFGALGLCAYMVVRGYQDKASLLKLLAEKDRKLEALHIETLKVIRKCQGPQEEGDSK